MKRALSTLTRSAATLALATGSVIALGVGSAHASTSCSDYLWSNYATEYRVCLNYTDWAHATVSWSVNTSYSKTDERFYLKVMSNCVDQDIWTNWNDWSESSKNYGSASIGCGQSIIGGVEIQLYPTESGSYSGDTASA
ncbi:hypothetical protein AV521_31430 [Streptomyces sp. IMTB 2501]|uniref:hypothetical protein n=1 Tax=Streptomyces sp. IMTB 2501 TaxID=1776340 RepID=UPI00096D4DA9|nr:hypothetical protein [Streptomyces sp. IMTB 2501]OLZ65568.1 hypothetical protein AV521_31430 [Streptomyces sp. IMTB 2501]